MRPFCAGEQFRKYASHVIDDERGKMLAGYCDKMAEWIKLPDKYNPKNVPSLNSPYADFSPVFFRQGVIITSDRPKNWKFDATYEWTGKPYFGFMFSWLKGMTGPQDPIYAEPELFDKNLDHKFHDGTATFSPDGRCMFFTRTLVETVPKDNDRFRTYLLKLYYSNFDGENWSEPEPFFLNSNDYSVGHPSFSPDGQILYFVSDMPGGIGGTDIWFCKKEENGWSEPENMGSKVNTIMNELFPYMDVNGTLYFASEGHMGYGGLDIFYSEKNDDVWGSPMNMMKGINTSHDDFGISLNHDLGIGLLSSDRPGGQGRDDIYAFELGPNMQSISGKVVDDEDKPLPGATVFMLNNNRKEVLILRTDSDGKYSARVTAKGYGETMLLNECTDDVECTEEEHQINRRTEFKVTSVDEFPEDWSLVEKYIEGDVLPLSRFGKNFFDGCLK